MSAGRPDVVEIYLKLPPSDIAYLKFIVESYEGIGVLRTIDRAVAVIVLIVAADFERDARAILDSLRTEVPWEEVPFPAADGRRSLVTRVRRARGRRSTRRRC
jgi:hypothetical protein